MSSLKLVLRRSDDPSRRPVEERPFSGAMMRIGRRPPPSDLGAQGYWQIDDKSISRAHCEIFTRGPDLFVSDLGSTNGTTLGGQRLTPQQPAGLVPGQEVALGELFVLTVEEEAEAPVAPTGPAPDPFGGQPVSSPFAPSASSDPFGSLPPAGAPQQGFPSAAPAVPAAPTASPFGSNAIDDFVGGGQPAPVTPHHVPQDTGGSTLDQVVDWAPNVGSLSADVPIDWDGGGAASREEDPFGTAAAAVPAPEPEEKDLWGQDGESQSSAAPATPAPALSDGSSLSSFLEGANLPLSSFADAEPADVLKRAGEIYRQAVLNYAQFLINRDKVKEEYQVDRTQIGAKNNSPLKFLAAEQAAEHMLKEPLPGFLDGPAAFRDASVDIKRHQIGLMAGTRAALEALLGEVARAAEANQAGGLKLPLLGAKQASGESLADVLTRLTEELQGNGRGVVFEAFRSAYDRVTQESEE